MNSEIKSPFKFLDSYGREDKEIFLGRDSEIEELYDRVFETDLVLLYGASGTGKTSLINCGLGNQFASTDWLPIQVRRTENLVADLHRAVEENAIRVFRTGMSLQKKVRSLYLDHFKPVHFIFDQFEELFIQGAKDEQQQFFEAINKLLSLGIQCRILLSMREEWIAHLSEFELIIPGLFDNRQRIEQMTRQNLYEVIRGTSRAFNIELVKEEETINLILNQVQDAKGGIELANLQIYLDKLYRNDEQRRNGQARRLRFDPELVAATRQLEDVLGVFLQEQLDRMEQELEEVFGIGQKGIPLDVLFALVTDDGTKRSIGTDLVKTQLRRRKNIDPKVVDYCVKRFNELRIVRIISDPDEN